VGSVELLFDRSAGPVGRLLECDGDRGLLAFVAQIAEDAQIIVGSGGGVVFTTGTHR
jgi:hypothetical protein